MAGDRILLIDDETELLSTLSERMETRGMRVTTAESGETAIELARERTFDAIVLDLAMPGIDGIETLRRLRELNPDLQVILLTGQATVQKSIEAMKLGAVDLLEKPADFELLIAKIEEASARKAELFEQRTAEKMNDIMRKKGW